MQRIFEYRNSFVHEIGIEVNGSHMMRETLGPDQALNWCQFAIDCIIEIESRITTYAPTNFPNCLDERGYARNEIEVLDKVINLVEDEITYLFANKDRGQESWRKTLPMTRSAIAAESAMCGELYARFFENATPSRMVLR